MVISLFHGEVASDCDVWAVTKITEWSFQDDLGDHPRGWAWLTPTLKQLN